MQQKYLIRTFGCQMNEHDSERIGGVLMADGMVPTEDAREAKVIVLNTCAIRENADNKLYGNLGHLKPLKDAEPRPADRGCGLPRPEGSGPHPATRAVGRRRGRNPRAAAPARSARPQRDRRAPDGRAGVHRGVPERAPGGPRRRRARLGLGRHRLRQRVHLLHRPVRARPPAVAHDRRHPRGGAVARRGRGRRDHAARSERQHVRPRSRDRGRAPAVVCRAAAGGQSG